MYVVDEGKSKVLEIGVFILETLGSVGLPAETATQALLRLANPADDGGALGTRRAARVEKLKSANGGPRRRRRKPRSSDPAVQAARDRRRRERAAAAAEAARACSTLQRSSDGSDNVFQKALRFVIEAKTSTPQQIISRILFYLADALGDSLDTPSQRDLERAVDRFVEEAHAGRGGQSVRLAHVPRPLSHSVTGVVLSYRERDDLQLPSAALHRLRRGMHFDIPMRPFDATVQLLPAPHRRQGPLCIDLGEPEGLLERQSSAGARRPRRTSDQPSPTAESAREDGAPAFSFDLDDYAEQQEQMDAQDRLGRSMAQRTGAGSPEHALLHAQLLREQNREQNSEQAWPPCTPQSFPPTPQSRRALLRDYSTFTDNVIWRARDELRVEHDRNARSRFAIFNHEDAHPKLALSCGGHCVCLPRAATAAADPPLASQQAGQQAGQEADARHSLDIYRSVRAALPLAPGRATYFEMCALVADEQDPEPLRICVGVASRAMPLRNAFPGLGPCSAGLDASGVLMAAPQRARAPGFGAGSLVGVLVRLFDAHAHVSFLVDGKPVQAMRGAHSHMNHGGGSAATTVIVRCAEAELFPVVSVRSRGVKVFGHFSAADMRHPDPQHAYWDAVAALAAPGEPVFALDGTLLMQP